MSPVIQIRKAQREGARLVIMLAGVSGSGKTRTALELAYGLTNYDPAKIGFLDTENRRGSLYSDVFADPDRERPSDVPFNIGDLYAPFSPQRYIEAIQAFQKAGVEVLIIDSGSHEWEGLGGCTDIAEAGNPRLPNWNKAKGEHKRFMNVLLTSDMHIILCLRAREKAVPEKRVVDGKEKTVYIDLGLQAITEKNVMFEATASLMLHDEGREQTVVKVPGPLQALLGRGQGYITARDGEAIRAWVDGAKQLDPKVEQYRNRLLSITDKGVKHVEDCWAQVPKKVQKSLGDAFKASLVASAAEFERQAKEATDDGGVGDLNRELAAGVATHPPANDNKPAPANNNAGAEPGNAPAGGGRPLY